MGINLHISFTYFEHESRVLKETKTIAASLLFDKVEIVAFGNETHPDNETINENRKLKRLKLWKPARRKGALGLALRILCASFLIIKYYRKKNISCVNAHSIFNLPVAVLLKKLTGCKLIYDAHELETERSGLNGLIKKIAKKTEALLIKNVDHIIVVGDKIKEWYETYYGIKNISVIYNYPLKIERTTIAEHEKNYFRTLYNLSKNNTIFIMQGLLDSGRSIELLLSVFSKASYDNHIVFMGYGPYEELIKEHEQKYINIHFHKAVAPAEVIKYTSAADVGISLIENICLSYYYSLPNKLFEYTLAELPSVVSDFPEMAAFIEKNNCGWKTQLTEEAISKLISLLSSESIKQKSIHAKIAAETINWKVQEEGLVNIYRQL